MKVFISYTRRDPDKRSRDFGRLLTKFLQSRGIDMMFDEFSFRPGYPLAEEMIDAIYSADKFLFIASPHAFDSNYVLMELTHARNRAIELQPEPFIHVVSLADDSSLDYLPIDLRAFLCHVAFNKSLNRIMYEIFFGIIGLPLDRLLSKELRRDPQADWIILERYQVIDILSKNGDTRFRAMFGVQNLGNKPNKYSHNMNVWPYGRTKKRRPKIEAELDSGEPIATVSVEPRQYHGFLTYTATFEFPTEVPRDEVCVFKTQYRYPGAFELNKGSSYTLDCEKGYGYLRVDVLFPRQSNPNPPTVAIKSFEEAEEVRELVPIGSNTYSYSMLEANPGMKFVFSLGLNV